MAKAKTKAKTKTAAKKSTVRQAPPKSTRQAMMRALEARKKADEAMEKAHMKVFAAKLIVHIAKEAGIAPPSMAIRQAVMERGRAAAAAARARAKSAAAEARARFA
ncbi:MAG: hypothetical protein OEV14_09380 [Gammaproteobacteria bacterium]|nr:hypothetical protein [Gammaproteobacteria bacterium]